MDEVIAGVLLLAATIEATYLAFAREVKARALNVYSVLALAAGGLFALFGDTIFNAFDAATK